MNHVDLRRLLWAVALAVFPARAQLGAGWEAYKPDVRIHLDGDGSHFTTFTWREHATNCSPICADYSYDAATETETFRLLDRRSNRSEIRVMNEYSSGSRQFEGYVTFFAPLNDESMMQIFGSTEGATQLMIRGYSAQGGSVRGNGDLAANCYGREMRVNVIHEQEDAGNRIRIFIDGVLKSDVADNERVTNYHKYGCYGSLRTNGATVKWRRVRHYRNGEPPSGNTAILRRPVARDGASGPLRLILINGRILTERPRAGLTLAYPGNRELVTREPDASGERAY